MQGVDWELVRQRTLALYQEGVWISQHSAAVHLALPLSEAEVLEAEQQFGITFPADYRAYLLQVSAGGRAIRELRRGEGSWHWVADCDTDLSRLHVAFPEQDNALAPWNADYPRKEDYAHPKDYVAAQTAWCEAVDKASDDRTTGAVFLSGDGTFSTLLIVSGPYRGTVWFDERSINDRIRPIFAFDRPPTFAEWYFGHVESESVLLPKPRKAVVAALARLPRGEDAPSWLRWFDDWGPGRPRPWWSRLQLNWGQARLRS